jgi:hypothetical protein
MKNPAHDIKKAFAVVEFTEEIFEDNQKKPISAVVPATWLSAGNSLCFWPEHLKSVQLYNCALHRKKPKADWKLHQVKRIVGFRGSILVF